MKTGRSRNHSRKRFVENLEQRVLLAGDLVISEFMATNQSGLIDEDGDFSDWIEISNRANQSINLEGWYLTDDANNLTRWQFPNVEIGRGEFLIVTASAKNRVNSEAPLHTDFRLNGGGEYLALVEPDGTTISFAYAPEFPTQSTDVSYGIFEDDDRQGFFAIPTPGTANIHEPLVNPEVQVLVNEIMYHPSSENDAEEYIELFNRGGQAVDLSGWRLSGGVDFEFENNTTINANGYLIVAADPAAFATKYRNAPNAIGPWQGRLSNGSDQITLRNNLDDRIDRVLYADEGDWSVRQRGPDDQGHFGWIWSDAHDGDGMSLELIDASRANEFGQNWKASLVEQGTPGRANSVAANSPAPFVLETKHVPIIPRSNESVVVSSLIVAAPNVAAQVNLKWRLDGSAGFSTLTMTDDGRNGDRFAGDSVYSTTIPAQADLSVVEFYVQALGGNASRTWPAETAASGQVTNALYQVLNRFFDAAAQSVPGTPPMYFEVMTAAEREEFTNINRLSDAQMNATFISHTSDGLKVRYNTGIRIRGSGSRNALPPNNRINFPSDRTWEGLSAINLNVDDVYNQIAGSAIFRMLGLPAAEAKPVRMISNGVNLNGNFYAHVETLNSDFASDQFPDDSNGNLYKGRRRNEGPIGGQGAGLDYFGEDPLPYVSYVKLTNENAADYTDVIHLTDVLNNAPDETYLEQLETVIDVEQWIKFFAINAVIANTEGGLVTGDRGGDDYAMYRGADDQRFILVPHDLDTILVTTNWSLLRMTNVKALERFILHPQIKPRYFETVRQVMQELLSERTDIVLEQALSNFGEDRITAAKQYLRDRAVAVEELIPNSIEISSIHPRDNDYFVSERPIIELHGTAGYDANSVTINGQTAVFSKFTNQWELGSRVNTVIPLNETAWQYNDNGVNLGTGWKEFDYQVDGSWSEGDQELGYGDNDETTVLDFGADPNNKHITTYFRHEFDIAESWRYLSLILNLRVDDGAIVYLNGNQVLRENMPAEFDFQTMASRDLTGSNENTYRPRMIDHELLRDGKNVLAVEVHQSRPNSNDLSFAMFVTARHVQTSGVNLLPGLNSVVVQTHDGLNGTGNVLEEKVLDFWYNDGNATQVAGSLGAGVTNWTVANSPYLVTADVTVPAGSQLRIEPGSTIYFEPATALRVEGSLIAEGTSQKRIRFTSNPLNPFVPDQPAGVDGLPDAPPKWNGIQLKASPSKENRIAHADIHHAQTSDGSIGIVDSHIELDDVSFRGTHVRMIYAQNASLNLQNSTFPNMFLEHESPAQLGLDNVSEHVKIIGRTPADGVLIIRNNHFGTNKGHNDVIDADSNRRSGGPILQVLNNTFEGGGDELLDLGGDVYVYGNVFKNLAKDQDSSDRGYASAISTGDAGADTTIVVAKNLFYEVDHAINLKNSAATIFENNTIVNVHSDFIDRFGNPVVGSVVNLFVDEPNATAGRGAYVAGNIVVDAPRLIGNADLPAGQSSVIQVEHNLLDVADKSVAGRNQTIFDFGRNNREGDPRFANSATLDFSLLPGSDAIEALNGSDLGWRAADGIWIQSQPASVSTTQSATFVVGGPGIFSYQYRLDGAAWSQEAQIGTGFDPAQTVRIDAVTLNSLRAGEHTIEFRGRDFAGNLQDVPTTYSWTVQLGTPRIVINEVLADNLGSVINAGSAPDVIELYNAGTTAVNLIGYSISDRDNRPEKFVFQENLILGPREYLVLYADSLTALAGIHLGFNLDNDGEGVFLFSPEDNRQTRTVVDSVEFGMQIGDLSIGRVGTDNVWALTEPSFGAANRMARMGDSSLVKINEWLAESVTQEDFVELYNPDVLPVSIGGYYVSDEFSGSPKMHEIQQLSFIGSQSFRALIADADTLVGPNHVNFRLSLDQEAIGFIDPTGTIVDAIVYYPQVVNVSQGRLPDGSANIAYFEQPTPGWANGAGVQGDFDGNGNVNVDDAELLCSVIRNRGNNPLFDLNRDGSINSADMGFLLRDVLNTSYGDTNLDGVFNSADLVSVFIGGEYEDGIPRNSSFMTGDWNCDGDFGTSDLVLAFEGGRYTEAATKSPQGLVIEDEDAREFEIKSDTDETESSMIVARIQPPRIELALPALDDRIARDRVFAGDAENEGWDDII